MVDKINTIESTVEKVLNWYTGENIMSPRFEDMVYEHILPQIIDPDINNVSDLTDNKTNLPELPHGYGTRLYHKNDKEHQYPVSYTEAYCQIHYNILKEHVCKVLDIPNYVYLDLEYMLSKYFD